MPDDTIRLNQEFVTKGAEEAAQKAEQVGDAQGRVKDRVEDNAEATGKLDDATKKLNASESDFTGLLTRIDPRLGAVADSLLQAAKISGDLAEKQIDLSSVTSLGTEVFTKYAGALKFLGAGAVAFVGFSKLKGAITEVREEAERATAALLAFQKAQTDIQESALSSAEKVVAGRDAAGLTPFSAEQAKSVEQTLAAAPEAIRESLGPLLTVFGGAKGFGAGGPFTGGDLEALARLGFQADPSKGVGAETARAREFLQQRSEHRRRVEERVREQAATAKQSAVREALHPEVTGGQANLRRIVEETARELGVDPDLVQREVEKRLRTPPTSGGFRGVMARETGVARPRVFDEAGAELPEVEVVGPSGKTTTREMTATEAAAIDRMLNKLLPVMERMANAAEKIERRPPTVNMPNARFIAPGRGRVTNGQSRLESEGRRLAGVP